MKVSYPLSLKLSLWLLLNLLLLAAGVLGLLVARGGFGLDSLARGPAGDRFQTIAEGVARDCQTARDAAGRARVLRAAAAAHGGEFFIFHPDLDGGQGAEERLPGAVARKLRERPPSGPGGPRREPGDEGPPGRPPQKKGPPRGGEDGGPPRGAPRPEDVARGRFMLRDGATAAYWAGARAQWVGAFDFERPNPATVVARVDSWWGVVRVLDLQVWFFAAGGVLAFSILFWLPFVRGMTRALAQLTRATGAIAEGKFDTRVPAARRDEFGALGGAVNQMAARLDTLVNGQKRFLADIAHELGSPVGRLQVAVEILESRADPALREHVADVREEVQQMSALVNELLAFTKAGLRARDAELAPVALGPLVQRVLDREDVARRVAANLPADLAARADAALLDRALGNLVRNALRYAPDGGVTLTVRADGAHVVLAVADDGPGVPPEALARLGEPFYRPEAARTREGGGVGLGLAIVKSAVAACGGAVVFRNRAPHGFEAEVRLERGGEITRP